MSDDMDPHGEEVLADSERQQLQKILDEEGLDTKYWLPKLRDILGVKNAHAMKHLSYEDYLKLEPHVQQPWEKHAFKNILHIPDSKVTLKKLQDERFELMKKKQEQAQLILKDLKDMQTLGKSQVEEDVKQKLETLLKAMSIPENSWPPSGKPLIEIIESLHKEIKLTESALSAHGNLDDKELLKWASGGRILQGIYKTNKLEDILKQRDHLISIPENFSLFGPDQGPVFQTKEFSSYSSEMIFTKVMEILGLSGSCKAKAGYMGFSLETSNDYSNTSELEKNKQSHVEHAYICTTKYNYIPLASCFFQKHQIKLSTAALHELKEIEKLLGFTTEQEKGQMINARFGEFFIRFGSHVDTGTFHLGGIYWWKASCEGFKTEELEDVKRIANKKLDVYVGASYSGLGLSIGGGVGVTDSHSEASFEREKTESVEKSIQLSVSKTGGPAEADSLTQWKSGLLANNKTWCVIDRGFNLIPVWDIILECHRNDFKDVLQVGRGLMEAYKAIPKQDVNLLFGEELTRAVEEAQAFLQDINSWELTDAEKELKKLIHFKQGLYENTKNNSTWIGVCLSNKVLPDFLAKVIKKYEKTPEKENTYIKTLMGCLVNSDVYSNDNASMYSSIMKWIYQSEEKEKEMCVNNFDQFICVLKQGKHAIEEAIFGFNSCMELVHEAQVKTTTNISLSLYSLLKALRATQQTEIELLIISFVVRLGYILETGYFRYILVCSEIDVMLNDMQAAHKEIVGHKKESDCRAQAFLLLTSLTLATERKEVLFEQKKERLDFIMGHLKKSLSKEVSDIVQKYNTCNDFKSLEEDLHDLIIGNREGRSGMVHKERLLRELNDISRSQGVNQLNIPVSETKDHCPTIVNTCAGISNKDISDLIKQIGLDNYYPNKLTPEHVHVVDQFTMQISGSQPSKDSELPFYFLQKLMIMDYRARDLACKVDSHASQSDSNVSDEILPPDESMNIMDRFFCLSGESHEIPVSNHEQVHPMDVQMAIYHCADDFMRQWISTKLSVCQYAIPLLLPKPCTLDIEFPLWSFRQVSKNWQQTKCALTNEKIYIEKIISGVSTPMVSFFRIGKSAHSKSQLMNALLNKQNRNIFFHRNCIGGSRDSVLMPGVAEIFWYCPSGNKDDLFDQCIAFTNLHGDAIKYKKQVAFLDNISSVNVVFMSYSGQNSLESQFLKDVLTSPKPSVFLCNDTDNSHRRVSANKVMLGLKNRNEAELIVRLREELHRLIATSTQVCKLEDCVSVAQKHGFHIDEDKEECCEGKRLANTLMCLIGDTPVTEVKEKFLPLQGSLWHKWCEKDKELTRLRHKGNRSIEQHRSEIVQEKNRIRAIQLKKADPINILMKSLIQILQSHSVKTKRFFLHWLKMYLDDLSSDQLLDLRQQYQGLISKQDARKGEGKDLNDALNNTLEGISNKINASMFGLEHIMREVGQIYEALDADVNMLPQIAADLMANGFPVELMDGDASYVPLKWVGAVLDELIKKIGDKKLIVLSVLGIQSSGKSTLLNTMFGLQFAVSAGRCTRGAFMQLVKIDEKLHKDQGFDYILVVDTEGLQSIERKSKSALNFDNELATFVIGLANMTLINVYGENASQIQDILQIAVQAFLRMRLVNLSPSCLFVHQNVGHLSAQDKNMEARECLQKTLDEMAKTAALQELCEVTCFSDVIRFDAKEHIHYFSHLWEGNPPMAPLNPNYSQNVQDLRNQILMMAKNESKSKVLSISQLKNRIEDLWRALVNENFVFSFKNTLEISAYSKLEKRFSDWTWQLRSHMLNLQNTYINRIKNGSINHIQTARLEEEFQEQYGDILKDLEVYFNEGTDCEILAQWRASVEKRLQVLKQELIEEIKNKCEELIMYKKSQSKLDKKKSEYEDNLFRKSKSLALTLKNEELDDEKLEDHFNCLWTQWVSEVSSNLPRPEDPNIKVDIEDVILAQFQQVPHLLTRYRDLSRRRAFSLDFSRHIQMRKNMFFIRKTLNEQDKKHIQQVTARLIQNIHEYIAKKKAQKMAYNVSFIHEILNIINKEASNASKGSNFEFTAEYQFDLALYVCHIAAESFIEMHKEFQNSNNPVAYLESKRDNFFNCFKISCQGTTSIAAIADVLCDQLEKAVQQEIYERAPVKIADSIRSDYPAFKENKAQFEKHILKSLAEKEDFDQYMIYIQFPRDYYESFIKEHIDEYCHSAKQSRLRTILNGILDSLNDRVVCAIGEATEEVKEEKEKAPKLLDALCKKLDDLNIQRSDLKVIVHQEISDLEFLKEAVSKKWVCGVERLRKSFADISLDSFDVKPHEILAKQLCGCMEHCPFCRAICTSTIPGHDGDHGVHFHRPQAVSGIQWYRTDHLVTDICSSLVASDCLLVLSESNQIPYKNYRQAGPPYSEWSIMPDSSIQSYWKWFVSHFRTNLETRYSGKFTGKGEIPPQWAEITKERAISELEQP